MANFTDIAPGLDNFATNTAVDVAYQQYLDGLRQLRNQLLGNLGIAQDGPSQDPATKEYYSKLKLYSVAQSILARAQQELSDFKIKNYYKAVKDNTEKNIIPALTPKVTDPQKVTSEFPFTTPQNKPAPNPSATDIEAGKKREKAVEEYHNANNLDANGGILNPDISLTMPEPGKPVLGHDKKIGEAIANKTEYEINGKKIFKAWASVPLGTIDQTTTADNPLLGRLDKLLEEQRKQTPGSYKFFIEKLHGKSYDGKFFKKGPIKSGLTPVDLPNRMVFPAYISQFNDSYDVGWEPYSFIGRGEEVYSYTKTTRQMTLEFYMMSDFSAEILFAALEENRLATQAKQTQKDSATNSAGQNKPGPSKDLSRTAHTTVTSTKSPDGTVYAKNAQPVSDEELIKEIKRIKPDWGEGTTPNSSYTREDKTGFIGGMVSGTPEQLWERTTFLTQCCYAWYRKDGKMKEQPFIRVRIGDFFDVICKINGLVFTEDEFDMDLNPSSVGAIPMAIKVSMNMTVIHEDEPTSEYRRFYHRVDYDTNDPDYIPGSGKATSMNKDSALDDNDLGSPIFDVNTLSNAGEKVHDFPKGALSYQESLKSFSGSLGNITNGANTLNDYLKKEKLKSLMSNAKRLLETKKKLLLNKIEPVSGKLEGMSKSASSAIKNVKLTDVKSVYQSGKDLTSTGQNLFSQGSQVFNQGKGIFNEGKSVLNQGGASLADSAIKDLFPTAKIPPVSDIVNKGKDTLNQVQNIQGVEGLTSTATALFPKFKTPVEGGLDSIESTIAKVKKT